MPLRDGCDSTQSRVSSSSRRVPSPAPETEDREPILNGNELDRYSLQSGPERILRPATVYNQARFLRALAQWKVAVYVELGQYRNHLANERTYLAWFRTSVLLSMLGIVTTQLFTIQPDNVSRPGPSFYMLGHPLGALCQAAALVNIVLGARKFWKHQNAMVRGEAAAGGWEMGLIAVLVFLITMAFFILILIYDFDRAPT